VVVGKSALSTSTISYFENRKRRLSALSVSRIRRVFEAAGVEFIAENGGGAGVRLRKVRPAISDEAEIPETPKDEPYDGSPM
jgi:hypothetical protein